MSHRDHYAPIPPDTSILKRWTIRLFRGSRETVIGGTLGHFVALLYTLANGGTIGLMMLILTVGIGFILGLFLGMYRQFSAKEGNPSYYW